VVAPGRVAVALLRAAPHELDRLLPPFRSRPWAIGLCTCSSFITHERRELVHFKVTSGPTAAWVWQQVFEATPWGRRPDYLMHDRDAVYGRNFGARLSKLGITSVRTPFQSTSCKRHRREADSLDSA
jgi:hypothetical protein